MSRERRTIPVMRDLSAAAVNCPLAPPEHASVYSRTLHRACLIVGGIDALAQRLGAPAEYLERLMRAEEAPAEELFLKCVEIMLLYYSETKRKS